MLLLLLRPGVAVISKLSGYALLSSFYYTFIVYCGFSSEIAFYYYFLASILVY